MEERISDIAELVEIVGSDRGVCIDEAQIVISGDGAVRGAVIFFPERLGLGIDGEAAAMLRITPDAGGRRTVKVRCRRRLGDGPEERLIGEFEVRAERGAVMRSNDAIRRALDRAIAALREPGEAGEEWSAS